MWQMSRERDSGSRQTSSVAQCHSYARQIIRRCQSHPLGSESRLKRDRSDLDICVEAESNNIVRGRISFVRKAQADVTVSSSCHQSASCTMHDFFRYELSYVLPLGAILKDILRNNLNPGFRTGTRSK